MNINTNNFFWWRIQLMNVWRIQLMNVWRYL